MPACARPGTYVPRQTHDCDAAVLVRRHLPHGYFSKGEEVEEVEEVEEEPEPHHVLGRVVKTARHHCSRGRSCDRPTCR